MWWLGVWWNYLHVNIGVYGKCYTTPALMKITQYALENSLIFFFNYYNSSHISKNINVDKSGVIKLVYFRRIHENQFFYQLYH